MTVLYNIVMLLPTYASPQQVVSSIDVLCVYTSMVSTKDRP